MRSTTKQLAAGVSILCLLTLALVATARAETMTIEVLVNEEFQLVDNDGAVYEVAATEKGDELLDYIGQVIVVTGTIYEEGEMRIFYVESYTVKS